MSRLRVEDAIAALAIASFIAVAVLAGDRGEAALPVSTPQCHVATWHHDERHNPKGPGRCFTDCDCDGLRSCVDSRCESEGQPDGGN